MLRHDKPALLEHVRRKRHVRRRWEGGSLHERQPEAALEVAVGAVDVDCHQLALGERLAPLQLRSSSCGRACAPLASRVFCAPILPTCRVRDGQAG